VHPSSLGPYHAAIYVASCTASVLRHVSIACFSALGLYIWENSGEPVGAILVWDQATVFKQTRPAATCCCFNSRLFTLITLLGPEPFLTAFK
jgi:hypothetical protein